MADENEASNLFASLNGQEQKPAVGFIQVTPANDEITMGVSKPEMPPPSGEFVE